MASSWRSVEPVGRFAGTHFPFAAPVTGLGGAARRASVLARLFRLYPKTLDERLIRVARVQAYMQASQETAAHYEEPFLWAE